MKEILDKYNIIKIRSSLIEMLSNYDNSLIFTEYFIMSNDYVFFELDDKYYIIYNELDGELLLEEDELFLFIHNLYT